MHLARPFPVRIRAFVPCAALALAGGLSSCIIGSNEHTENSGTYVSPATLQQITPGKDKDYVTALIGQPSDRTALADGTEIWKWRFTETRNSEDHVIFIVSSNNRTETQRTTFVEFKGSTVVKAWSD